MILRIFATDGFTPERIFRWSVEETAKHLCQQQVLWVTRLDGPWRPLVDWFVKQPCCRAVVLDVADCWDWYAEHEVTLRLARGLYYDQDKEVEAVCWIHDDMAPPECGEFKEWLKQWLRSDATAVEAPAYQLWDRFDQIRVDPMGLNPAGDLHCWMAKWKPDLEWIRPHEPASTTFHPRGANTAVSPWAFRHAKCVDEDFRNRRGFNRRGSSAGQWQNTNGMKCLDYGPSETWAEFRARVEA